jgi:glycine/D-amino acid oxidase-like deaminating enzyme
VASALLGEGRRLGCAYRFNSAVQGIEPRSAGAVLRCSDGDVEADVVVNAAGPQARDIAALLNVDLPVLPYRRNLACTEPISALPARMPMCVDVDTGLLVRREGDGALVGYSPANSPTADTTFDPAFLDDIGERAGNRFPFLAEARIDRRKCWAGSYPETSDHHAIIDAPRHAPWFIQCAGFGGHGIMHSLAAGQAVAELVRDQRCTTFDLTPLRLDRFDGWSEVETAVI